MGQTCYDGPFSIHQNQLKRFFIDESFSINKSLSINKPFLPKCLLATQSPCKFGQGSSNLKFRIMQYVCGRNPSFIIQFFPSKKMGNGEFEVPLHLTNQWSEVYRSNKKYFRNNITLEEFEFMVIQKLPESQHIQQLIERSIYSIPKTPRIIILDDHKDQLFILAQEFYQPLAQHLSKMFLAIDILELLSQAFTVFDCLVKKYGPFGVTEGMMGFSKNAEIFAWINENRQKNQVQIPIQTNQHPQRLMIAQVISIFKRYTGTLVWQQELLGHNSFQSVQKHLTKMIQNRKIEMASSCSQTKNQSDCFRRALSPQTSFGSLRQIQVRSPKVVQDNAKCNKKYNVPNFLKRITAKKPKFLDQLNHKRTVTINEAQKDTLSKERKGQNREKCSSKSLSRVKSLKVFPTKDRNSYFSGEMSYFSFPTSSYKQKTCDLLTQSGSSCNDAIKKPQFQTTKTANNWKFQSIPLKNTKENFYNFSTPTSLRSNHREINGQSCLFQAPTNSRLQTKAPISFGAVNLNVPLLAMCNKTTVSSFFNESKRQKEAIIQEQSHSISKSLEDEVNDLFSNPSNSTKSSRLMLKTMPYSKELHNQFRQIIDF